jgi:hypothetical protein
MEALLGQGQVRCYVNYEQGNLLLGELTKAVETCPVTPMLLKLDSYRIPTDAINQMHVLVEYDDHRTC